MATPTALPQTCPGCALIAPAVEGATDPYRGASPACWAIFQQVTLRQHQELHDPNAHQLTVDAYLSQHPGLATAAGRRSVALHLVGLCLALERHASGKVVIGALARLFADKPDIAPLEPVPWLGELTVASLRDPPDPAAYARARRAWAESVWRAWTPFHARIRSWADDATARR